MLCSRLLSRRAAAVGRSALLDRAGLQRQLPQLTFATTSVRASSGDHVRMWTAEKVVSAAQVPAIIIPFLHTTPLAGKHPETLTKPTYRLSRQATQYVGLAVVSTDLDNNV